jgi:colanic acid/amylovoran biosynthesis protein
MKRALDDVSLVYARDAASLNYLTELCPAAAHIQRAPDLTNIISPADTSDVNLPKRCAAIVPNIRMLDRTAQSEQKNYIPFLVRCIRVARDLNLVPVMFFHTFQEDGELANLVDKGLGFTLPRISESCPMRLKGLLSRAEVVIGSRFHALVGALSSGVPSLATSWNHKYAALFEDYGCPDFVVTSAATTTDIAERLAAATTEPSGTQLRAQLQERSREFRRQTTEMFEEVESRIDLRSPLPIRQNGKIPDAQSPVFSSEEAAIL